MTNMNKSVVVIDDDEDVREVIAFALENDGLKVIPFENGKEGYHGVVALHEMPGLIIVDYLMPEMDGLAFIQKLRKEYPETFGKVPIAISSAMGKSDPQFASLEGLILLHKPMDLDDLLLIARQHCKN